MLLEDKKKKEIQDEDRIKCGKCSAEYLPRQDYETLEFDYSCPVCKFGKFTENYQTSNKKQILLD